MLENISLISEDGALVPIVFEVSYESPSNVFSRFCDEPWSMLFESADGEREAYGTNRFSYIVIDPFKTMVFKNQQFYIDDVIQDNDDLLMRMKHEASQFQLTNHVGLSPFQGGVAGLLSYDLCHLYENIPRSNYFNDD